MVVSGKIKSKSNVTERNEKEREYVPEWVEHLRNVLMIDEDNQNDQKDKEKSSLDPNISP